MGVNRGFLLTSASFSIIFSDFSRVFIIIMIKKYLKMKKKDLLTYVINASSDNIKLINNISVTTDDCLNKLDENIKLINDSLYFSDDTSIDYESILNIKENLKELSYMTQSIKNNSTRVAEDLNLTLLVVTSNDDPESSEYNE